MDYFSELVIYLSLLSLAEKPDLWSQFGAPTEKRLLFKAEDFKNPDQSDVFREIENLSTDVKQLALKLKEFCKRPVDQLEPLEAILPSSSPAQVVYDQGIAYLHSNRYNEAISEFKKAITLDPKFREAYHRLGRAHLKMGNSEEARRAAEAALRIDLCYQPAHQLLGAIKSLTSRSVPPSRTTKGSGQVSTKRWQYITGALAFLLLICIVALAIQISEKDEVLRRATQEKTQLLRENQRLQNQLTEQDKETKTQIAIAEQLRSEKEELRSQNQELRNENTMLQNQSERGTTTSAVQTLLNEKAQLLRENQRLQNQLTEQDKETKTQIAIAEQLRSEKEELRSQNRKLRGENTTLREQLNKQKPPRPPPDDSDQFRAAPLQKIDHSSRRVDSTARSKNNQGLFQWDYNKAIEFFEDAVRIDSQSAIIHYNLGSAYLAMKEYAKSVTYLQEAVRLDPKFKEAYYNLALAYLRWGYPQKAKKAAQAALNIDENYRPAHQLLDYINRLMETE